MYAHFVHITTIMYGVITIYCYARAYFRSQMAVSDSAIQHDISTHTNLVLLSESVPLYIS